MARRGVRVLLGGGRGRAVVPVVPAPGRGARVVTRSTAFFRERRYGGTGSSTPRAVPARHLRKRIGPARFAVALRRYAMANRYGWSTGAEFRAAMDAASRVPLDDLWRRYRVR